MKRQIVVDTETTGVSHLRGHRIIEIALVEVNDNKITGNTYQSYFYPDGRKITKGAYKVHQIENDLLVNKPIFKDKIEEIKNFIDGAELVFFNKEFDLNFLNNEANIANHEIDFKINYKSICLMEIIANGLSRKNGRISLDTACRIYGIDTSGREVHGALIDTTLTAELLIELQLRSELIKRVPHTNERREREKFPFPRAYKDQQYNFCKNTKCKNFGVPPTFPKKDKNGKYSNDIGDYRVQIYRSKKNSNKNAKVLVCKLCKTASYLYSNKSIVQETERLKSIYELKIPSCPNTALKPNISKGIPDGRRYKKIQKKIKGNLKTFNRLKAACSNVKQDIINYSDSYWLDSKSVKKIKNSKGLPKISHPDSTGKYHNNNIFISQKFKCKKCHTKFSVPLNAQKGQSNYQINYQLFSELVNKGIINRISEKLRINHSLIYSRIEFFYNQCIQFDQYMLHKNICKLQNKKINMSIDKQLFYSNWTSKKDARRTLFVNISTVDNSTRFAFASTVNFDFTSNYKSFYKEFIRIGEYKKEVYNRRYQQYILPEEGINDDLTLKAPSKHLLVHQTYSLFSHLELLKKYINNLNKVNLFGDDDVGFDSAIPKVLRENIESNKLNVCIVRPQQLKKNEVEKDGAYQWIPQEKPVIKGKYIDVKLLTDSTYKFYNHASLHGVDNYFQVLRRRLNMLERPLKSSPNTSTEKVKDDKWNVYGSYNPKYISMLIEIMRVYNNYILTDEKSIAKKKGCTDIPQTPAQKLGLVDTVYSIYDILDFSVGKVAVDFMEQFSKKSAV
ncbi:hypothetical protein D5018_15775 [Parashewanella curva]|uniref:DNA-directed DNA polymerase n=1 Tax=Parashewanella curva TaxID=2338552 RepID=A0A3L8PTH0_9GAMM|nr:exonuclease domain-containing protein [Parashewanella curva]RLV58717.1 hypothetical protein D5018_15775 [Parashewanella curva]